MENPKLSQETDADQIVSPSGKKDTTNVRNPWGSGSFYLTALVVVVLLFLVVAKVVHPVTFSLVVIGAILAISVIGALQLKQDQQLNQENFLKLMALTFRYLPTLIRGKKNNTQ